MSTSVRKSKNVPDVRQLNDAERSISQRSFSEGLVAFLEGSETVDVDEHQLELTRFVREAALRRFGSARSAPMKPWISAVTWSFLRLIAPVRRSFHAAFGVAKKLEK